MNPIPKLARHVNGWFQPSKMLFYFTEDGYAVMLKETWESLRSEDQAGLVPIVVGLMWRRQEGEKRYLCWYNDKARKECAEVMDKRTVELLCPPPGHQAQNLVTQMIQDAENITGVKDFP
jgi:hypothetical protein